MPQYIIPNRLSEATKVLKEKRGKCLIVAGGTDLVIKKADEDMTGKVILDVSQVEEMRKIEVVDDALLLGAAVTFAEIGRSPLIPSCLDGLKMAALEVGSPQIRNIATVGGNLGTSSPGGDINVVLMGLDTQVVLASAGGTRKVSVEDFFVGPQKNAAAEDEIIVSAEIKLPRRSQYRKLALRRALALAITALGLSCYDTGNGEVWYVSFGALAPTPIRAGRAQDLLAKGYDIDTICAAVWQEVDSLSGKRRNSLRGSIEYKQDMAAALLREMLEQWEYMPSIGE